MPDSPTDGTSLGRQEASTAPPKATPSPAAAIGSRETVTAVETADASQSSAGYLAAAPAAPSQIKNPDRYEIIAEHGRGGLGRVSRARDLELDRDVAIKELLNRTISSEARFAQEARITARLEHPNIVPVHEAGRWPDGTPFYAMKLVAGRPLRELISERTTVEARLELLDHVIAVADAIAYAHTQGIIHRDLKPANVIVGDFGETIVIDWGLAKDLRASVEPSVPAPLEQPEPGGALTRTGAVLGTPAYMSPEQERGEHVDERADVFAIGAMLWEICALQRVPPSDLRLRHRILRRSRINQDLITILDKALATSSDQRYKDAGRLVDDLRAFKSGQRIAARNYSTLDIVAHWARRHRKIVYACALLMIFAGGGFTAYIHNIQAERARAEASRNRLILEHAELLLRSDPTAASKILEEYWGSETTREALLRAKANGLGIASLATKPHTGGIIYSQYINETTLLTASYDGTIALSDEKGKTTTIAGFDTTHLSFTFSNTSALLAYICGDHAVCLLNPSQSPNVVPAIHSTAYIPVDVSFSPDGSRLAVLSSRREVEIWTVSAAAQDAATPTPPRFHIEGQHSILLDFLSKDLLLSVTDFGIELVDINQGVVSAVLPMRHVRTASTDQHGLIALGDDEGTIWLTAFDGDWKTHRFAACIGAVAATAVISETSSVAYACRHGDAGIWKTTSGRRNALGHFDGGLRLTSSSADGRFQVFAGDNGGVLVHDDLTGHSITYLGHATRITSIAPVVAPHYRIATGDTTGHLRVWKAPPPAVSVAVELNEPMLRAISLPGDKSLLAIGTEGTLVWHRDDNSNLQLRGHQTRKFGIAVSDRPLEFVAYGVDGLLEFWSLASSQEPQNIDSGSEVVRGMVGMSNGKYIFGDRAGVVTEWSAVDRRQRRLGIASESIEFLRAAPRVNEALVGGNAGGLWIARAGRLVPLGRENQRIVGASISGDGNLVAIATVSRVHLYDTHSLERSMVIAAQAIEDIEFSPDNRSLAVATPDQVLLASTAMTRVISYTAEIEAEFPLSVRSIIFSPNNRWLAATADGGGLWLYSLDSRHWTYTALGTSKMSFGEFSPDSSHFYATDSTGKALVIDIDTYDDKDRLE